ncbi:SH3 domain-containing protein [Qipengyuania sp. MTN3-11]|uniref:SH3 domain-containing protein n=1 Tax=Qipengyuania sp. MTN3-11 TaxID=3056557 RepID=UPI0036F429A9
MTKRFSPLSIGAALLGCAIAAPAMAQGDDLALTACPESLGTIAVVDGDTQGWSEYGLGSPRELINSLAVESGCFTPHGAAAGVPADFLMNVVAGDSEEVDKSIELAKSAAMEGLVRSGAASAMLSNVPLAGSVLGMFGGLGGKKKRVAAGIKVLDPASGLTIVTGSGEVRKSTLNFGGGTAWNAGASASGYGQSKDGKMLVEAFVIAFNEVVAQKGAIAAVSKARPGPSAAPQSATATVAVDTLLRAAPDAAAAEVRSLRAGTELTATGARDGLFIEVEDNYGTRGWVSVEDLG